MDQHPGQILPFPPDSPFNEPLLLKVSEVARLLSLSEETVYRMCRTGELPCVRRVRSVRVSRRAVDCWIATQEGRPIGGSNG